MCRECRSNPHLPGCSEAPEGKPILCPNCGEAMETVIRRKHDGQILGCDNCTEELDAGDWELLGYGG